MFLERLSNKIPKAKLVLRETLRYDYNHVTVQIP